MNKNTEMNRREAVIEVMAILMAVLIRVAKETNNVGMRRKLEEVWKNSIPMTVNQFVRRVGWIVNTRYKMDAEHAEQMDHAVTRVLGAIDVADTEYYLGLTFHDKIGYMFFDQDRLDKMLEEATIAIEEIA